MITAVSVSAGGAPTFHVVSMSSIVPMAQREHQRERAAPSRSGRPSTRRPSRRARREVAEQPVIPTAAALARLVPRFIAIAAISICGM
jgi:hypothetical protein